MALELKSAIVEARKELKLAQLKVDNRIWEYVRCKASEKQYVDKILNMLNTYLVKKYNVSQSNADEVLGLIRDGMTMAPVTDALYRTAKYGIRVWYDTILFEWFGERVAYFRINENNESFNEGDRYDNGFHMDKRDFDSFDNSMWWKTEYGSCEDKRYLNKLANTVEKMIINGTDDTYYNCKPKTPTNIIEELYSLPPEMRIIRLLFDMKDGCHYLIHNDANMISVAEFVGDIENESESESESESDLEI